MDELEILETELEALNMRRAWLEQRIQVLKDQRTRAVIIAAGFDPEKRYRVDHAYLQWYRENVSSGGDSDFCDKFFKVEWIDDDRVYVKSIEKYFAVSASVPKRFVHEAVQS